MLVRVNPSNDPAPGDSYATFWPDSRANLPQVNTELIDFDHLSHTSSLNGIVQIPFAGNQVHTRRR
jgi:hypothetical protein